LGRRRLHHLDAVLVGAGEEEGLLPLEPRPARNGVGHDHLVGVADMRRAVRIGDGGSDVEGVGHGAGATLRSWCFRIASRSATRVCRMSRLYSSASARESWALSHSSLAEASRARSPEMAASMATAATQSLSMSRAKRSSALSRSPPSWSASATRAAEGAD